MKRMEVLGWWSLGRSWQLAELANCSLRQGDRVRENRPRWLCLFDWDEHDVVQAYSSLCMCVGVRHLCWES